MARRRPTCSAVLSALAGILILASGCVEQSPTSVQLRAPSALSAAKAYTGGSYSASIGTSGGTLNFPIGQIVFPAGAVSETTQITATLDGKTLSVDFQPHLEFPAGAKPTLTLSFTGLSVDISKLVVYHISDDGVLIETLSPWVSLSNATANVQVGSFSGLVLGVGRT